MEKFEMLISLLNHMKKVSFVYNFQFQGYRAQILTCKCFKEALQPGLS